MKKARFALCLLAGLSFFLFISNAGAYTRHQPKGLIQWDKDKAEKGFIIYDMRMDEGRKTVLVDIAGNVVNMWDGSGQEMLPPDLAGGEKGHVLVAQGSKLQERDWNNNVVWEYDAKALGQHHDWQKLPDGNYLILGRADVPEDKVPTEFYGAGFEGKQPVKFKKKMYGDRITEVSPDGKIVWDWFTYDHLDLQHTSNAKSWFNKDGYIEVGDWTHFNAIHYSTNPGWEDMIVASDRHQNKAIIIDKKTGDVVWEWGEDIIGHQHDVQMIDPGLPGEGNILLFDNGYGSKIEAGVSTIFEVDPKTKEIVWFFYGVAPMDGSFRSWHISGCQRMPNGNTFITEGETGRLFEVTPSKEIVWEYVQPFQNQIYRARKVPTSWVPQPVKISPVLSQVADLMARAKAQYSAAEDLVNQANQLLKYEISE